MHYKTADNIYSVVFWIEVQKKMFEHNPGMNKYITSRCQIELDFS